MGCTTSTPAAFTYEFPSNVTTVSLSHLSGVAPDKLFCINRVLAFAGGTEVPISIPVGAGGESGEYYQEWLPQGHVIVFEVPTTMTHIAFSSSDATQFRVQVHSSSSSYTRVPPQNPVAAVHWSDDSHRDKAPAWDDTDESNWAYTVVTFAENRNEAQSFFSPRSQLCCHAQTDRTERTWTQASDPHHYTTTTPPEIELQMTTTQTQVQETLDERLSHSTVSLRVRSIGIAHTRFTGSGCVFRLYDEDLRETLGKSWHRPLSLLHLPTTLLEVQMGEEEGVTQQQMLTDELMKLLLANMEMAAVMPAKNRRSSRIGDICLWQYEGRIDSYDILACWREATTDGVSVGDDCSSDWMIGDTLLL